jgi:hypothetical protein
MTEAANRESEVRGVLRRWEFLPTPTIRGRATNWRYGTGMTRGRVLATATAPGDAPLLHRAVRALPSSRTVLEVVWKMALPGVGVYCSEEVCWRVAMRRGAVHITLTTHGLDDATFAATREDWWSWWSSQVDYPRLAIN